MRQGWNDRGVNNEGVNNEGVNLEGGNHEGVTSGVKHGAAEESVINEGVKRNENYAGVQN